MLYFDGQYLRATREYEVVLDTGEYEVNGINLFARMADCALQSGNYSDAINLYDEINEDEMTSEDFFKKQSRMKKMISLMKPLKLQNLLSKDPDFIQGYFYLQSLYENEKIILMPLKQAKRVTFKSIL